MTRSKRYSQEVRERAVRMVWQNFALQLDVPKLEVRTPPGLEVYIIPAAQYGTPPMGCERFAILPAPTVELFGYTYDPHFVEITFPTLSVEWIEWSQTARYRAGNVVLDSNVDWWWDETNPNAIYIDELHIDLVSGVVHWCRDPVNAACYEPVPCQVIIDDGDPGSVYLEPDLWW